MDIPKYLYHYTSIDSLALILSSKSIRFNSTFYVDDPKDGFTSDLENVGHHFLISCWSSSENESIALWNMYASKYKGCIIKMPRTLFKNHNMAENYDTDDYPSKKLFEDEKSYILTAKKSLIQIDYKENYQPEPFIIDKEGNPFFNNLKPISIKSIEWQFQKEWRFVLYQIPNKLIENDEETIQKDLLKSIDNYSLSYFDLEIDNESFWEMEIVYGPHCIKSDLIILESLKEKFNKTMKISKSMLNIRNEYGDSHNMA